MQFKKIKNYHIIVIIKKILKDFIKILRKIYWETKKPRKSLHSRSLISKIKNNKLILKKLLKSRETKQIIKMIAKTITKTITIKKNNKKSRF